MRESSERRRRTIRVKPQIRINSYSIISRAIEEGISYGFSRAHKHTDHPSPEEIKTAIERAVMDALSEVIDFDD